MRWSKLRQLVRANFAEGLAGRLDIHSTAYGSCSCGHAWLTWDGEVIANFCTRAFYIAEGMEPGSPKRNPMYKNQLADFGEFSRQDAYRACWAFVHELSIEGALEDADPLVQALAVVDGRLGKRRLSALDPTKLHRIAAALLQMRLELQGMQKADAA